MRVTANAKAATIWRREQTSGVEWRADSPGPTASPHSPTAKPAGIFDAEDTLETADCAFLRPHVGHAGISCNRGFRQESKVSRSPEVDPTS